jgi:pimeloyl-ACP methyl ester carboxylesterase
MIRVTLFIWLAVTSAFATGAAPDYAREARWATEVVPQIVVGDAVWLAPAGLPRVLAIFTEPAGTAKGAVIVVHGLGVHPDWNLIGELRTKLADRGYATLAVQMPVLAADAPRDAYRDLSPNAGDRLTAAVVWLRARGFVKIAIVLHSMGALMTDAYLARHDSPAITAWVPVGMLADFTAAPRMPVLDVVAERDFPEVLAAAKLRAQRLPRDRCSAPLTVSGTDHYMNGATTELASAAAVFLEQAFARDCEGQAPPAK